MTTDGEVFDQTALAAAHPTIQLPAIARLTNLENGREVTVRLNDRGSGDPHRLVEITRRTAHLLDMPPDGVARVRLHVLPDESHAAAEALSGRAIPGHDRRPARRGGGRGTAAARPASARATARILPVATVAAAGPRPSRRAADAAARDGHPDARLGPAS